MLTAIVRAAGLLSPRLAPLFRRAAAPLLSPRRRSHRFPRQLQTPRSTPLTASVAKNALGDRTRTTTEFPSRQKALDAAVMSQGSTSPKSANKNVLAILANMADLAASQKPALFHPPGLPSNNLSPFLSRPPHPSATPKSLPPNAFQLPVAILSPRSPFATEIPRATEFERLGRVCSRLLKNGTRIDAD